MTDLLVKKYSDGRSEFYDPLEDDYPMGTLYDNVAYTPEEIIEFLSQDLGNDVHVEDA